MIQANSFEDIEVFFKEFPNLSREERLSCWAALYWVGASARSTDINQKNRFLSTAAYYFRDAGILGKAELIEKEISTQNQNLTIDDLDDPNDGYPGS